MTEEQTAAYVMSQSAAALIRAMGMQAENQFRALRQESPAYVEDDFERVILDFGLHHNSVVNNLLQG